MSAGVLANPFNVGDIAAAADTFKKCRRLTCLPCDRVAGASMVRHFASLRLKNVDGTRYEFERLALSTI